MSQSESSPRRGKYIEWLTLFIGALLLGALGFGFGWPYQRMRFFDTLKAKNAGCKRRIIGPRSANGGLQ